MHVQLTPDSPTANFDRLRPSTTPVFDFQTYFVSNVSHEPVQYWPTNQSVCPWLTAIYFIWVTILHRTRSDARILFELLNVENLENAELNKKNHSFSG